MRADPIRLLLMLLLAGLPLACSDDAVAPPSPPVITVSGVEDGGRYEGPVTIGIQVSRGTYTATLNGATFFGGEVSAPGEHTLRIEARDGTARSTREVDFDIVLAGSSVLIVRMFDLGDNAAGGGGDAVLLTDSSAAGMVHVLVDAGPAGTGGADPGFVSRRLQALGIGTLEALVLSHAHSDHYQGMPAVLNGTRVERFVHNGQARDLSSYNAVLSTAQTRADEVVVLRTELSLDLGGTRLTLLPPLPDFLMNASAGSDEINEGSIGGVVRKGAFDLFLTGDGEVRANARWRVDFPTFSRDVDALKVGHHGANDAIFDNGFSGSSSWLDHTDPELALISANGRSHPRVNALSRLLTRSTLRTYCTSVHGDITVRVGEAGSWLVSVGRNAAMDCVPGADANT